jgi:hypothetical protein
MNFTQYFLATPQREDRKSIKVEWIEFVFNNYITEEIQTDKRIKRWTFIEEVQK